MSHDFGIRNTKKKDFAWFFGFANGLMYHAFDEIKHYAGVSGDGRSEIKSYAETEKALDWAISEFDSMGYPDPNRLDQIKEFRQNMAADAPSDFYEVWFG